ncbi:hypothetical protein AB9P05_10340 [Roseivirga sp. BDSF3-8]|uniref:hypothetical protein n=1 Tax=Roseivirga sp. BDSF3-8 TaxID=3241598 RepID=UPI003531B622
MQTNEKGNSRSDKDEYPSNKGDSEGGGTVSRKEEKLKENLSEDTEENDYGGLPDTGNFKKFLGCGG